MPLIKQSGDAENTWVTQPMVFGYRVALQASNSTQNCCPNTLTLPYHATYSYSNMQTAGFLYATESLPLKKRSKRMSSQKSKEVSTSPTERCAYGIGSPSCSPLSAPQMRSQH